MKLNWFSPLPPAHSAVATYAAAVLPELARHAEVTVWSEQPSAISPAASGGDPAERGRWAARPYQPQNPPWDEINRADASIYHIGNHALFHGAIWDLCRRQPGIVVLHDARLQELAVSWAELRRDREGYLGMMTRYHGARGAAAGEDVWTGAVFPGDLVEAFPLTAAFVDRALGVVVHSDDARRLVEPVTAGPILCTALPYRASNAAVAAREWCAPFRLIMFGFLGGNRGIDAALAALAALPERNNFHLDIYGDVPRSDDWQREIRTAGLDGHVTLHGFVTDAELAAALDRAHLALNLRKPSRGEASFSLLQAWDHGLPAIVSRGGWFDEIPAPCVAYARPEHARDDLIRHLQTLAVDPETYRDMGLAGRDRLLRDHTPQTYAQHLARLAAAAGAQRGRSNALQMADRAAAALRDVGMRHLDGWALERISAAIHALAGARRPR